jgi:predicted dehydrogenase
VSGGAQPAVTAADAVAALRISLAATISCHEGRPVEVAAIGLA